MFFPPLVMCPLGPELASWPWPLRATEDFYEVSRPHNEVPPVIASLLEVLQWDVSVSYDGPDAPSWGVSATFPAGTRYFKNFSAGIEQVGNSPGWENPSHILERHHHPEAVSGDGDYSLNALLTEGFGSFSDVFYEGTFSTVIGVGLGFVEDEPSDPSWRLCATRSSSWGGQTISAIAGIATVDYSFSYPLYSLQTYTNSIEIRGLDTSPIIIGEPVTGWSVIAEVTARTELEV